MQHSIDVLCCTLFYGMDSLAHPPAQHRHYEPRLSRPGINTAFSIYACNEAVSCSEVTGQWLMFESAML